MTTELSTVLPLTEDDRTLLKQCEARIAGGIYSAWQALRVIHDNNLWREYGSFDEYCKVRQKITGAHGLTLVRAAEMVEQMLPYGVEIPSESVAKAILNLEPVQRIATVLLAQKASQGDLSASWIKAANSVVIDIKATGGYVDDGNGAMTAAEAATIDAMAEQRARQREHIRSNGKETLTKIFDTHCNLHTVGKMCELGTEELYKEDQRNGQYREVRVMVYFVEPKEGQTK